MAAPRPRTAREAALLALSDCARGRELSDQALRRRIEEAGLDRRDAALAARLCFGVLQTRMLCDFYLDRFSRVKTKRMEEKVLDSLRLGAYQLLFLDRIPASAAVDESVKLARRYSANPRAAGLVNGVLRALLRERDSLPQPPDLATRTSHPQWLVDALAARLDRDELEELLRLDNEPCGLWLQLMPGTDGDALRRELTDAGAEVEEHPWLPRCWCVTGLGDPERLDSFRQGRFYVQDPAARLAVLAAVPEPGQRVLDACAAPGGKSFAAAAEMGGRGEVVSCDVSSGKVERIGAGARRLGLDCVRPLCQDATQFQEDFAGRFDLVLTDVPCSGLGVIRKKPDIRYKDPAGLEELPGIQRAILDNVSRYVRPGGALLYSTCTLLERENEEIAADFLRRHPEFSPEPFDLPGPLGRAEGMLTLWPQRHGTDGFFIAKLRRQP